MTNTNKLRGTHETYYLYWSTTAHVNSRVSQFYLKCTYNINIGKLYVMFIIYNV